MVTSTESVMHLTAMTALKFVMVVMVIMSALVEMAVCLQPNKKSVSCLLVFGDSSVDPGNNNHLNTSFKANFPPYGKNLFHGQCSGRFTNGKLPTDMTAEALGIKAVIPAFLDPKLKKEDLLTGVSFASSASGYDDLTANLTNVLPVSKQLEYFRHYKIHLRSTVGVRRAEETVKNALFILSMGTNDFLQNYYLEPIRSKQFTVQQYTDYLAKCMTRDIKEMHRLGATRLIVVGLPPLGCMPMVRTLAGTTACVDTMNQASLLMNSKIKVALAEMSSSLGMKIGYEDIYTLFKRAIKFPKRYGFTETSRGCVGSGTVEIGEACQGLNTCKDPSKYVFWDAVHPTEKMYKIVSDDVMKLMPFLLKH